MKLTDLAPRFSGCGCPCCEGKCGCIERCANEAVEKKRQTRERRIAIAIQENRPYDRYGEKRRGR